MHHSERWLKLGDEVHERVPPLNAAGPAQRASPTHGASPTQDYAKIPFTTSP